MQLIGNTKKYKENVDKDSLSKSIVHLLHSVPWPISPDTQNFHLAHYPGEEVIIDLDMDPPNKQIHPGIDIQIQAGTPVYSPSDGIIYNCSVSATTFYQDGSYDPPQRGKDEADIIIESLNDNLFYILAHMSLESIPERLKHEPNKPSTEAKVKQGEYLGNVFKWPHEHLPCVPIPEDIEQIYGRKFDHLHFETIYRLRPTKMSIFSSFDHVEVNPLLLLTELR